MDKITRVTTALKGGTPDMVPYIYNTMMRGIQERILGRTITDPCVDGINIAGWMGAPGEKAEVVPSLTAIPDTAKKLGMDAIEIQILPPLFTSFTIHDGNASISGSLIDSEEAFKKALASMPDPDDDKLLREVEEMIKKYKGDLAMGARVRLGVANTLLSVGIENLSMFYADEDETLTKTIDMYTDYCRKLNKNLNELDFDFFWCFDDIAFDSSLLISPTMFRELFKDNMIKASETITKPWIYHSDGNYQTVLDDIVEIGANAIHPIEKAAMDTKWLKENYGKKLCLVGNIDINYTLAEGTLEEVEQEVKDRIELLGPGGGYIISDSNSIPDFCKPENIIAMAEAVEKYRRIY